MRFDNQKILIGTSAITVLLFPVVILSTGVIRIILGLLFAVFFPGYTLLSALFPKQDDLGGVERLALSFGLSIAIVPLIGFILNYSPWGINLYSILISIALFIIVTSAVGWYRQRKLPAGDRFSITFKASLPSWASMSNLDKGLSICLVVAIVAALSSLGYAIAMPKQGESFTEFYILGLEKKAEDYPQQVLLDTPVEIVIGVVNHEYQPTSYMVEMRIDGTKTKVINMGSLARDEKREQRVSFTPKVTGEKHKLDFYLYRNNETQPYFNDPLYLYVDVVTFCVFDAEGKAVDDPQQIKQGEPVELIVGVVNNDEYQPTNYRVEIKTEDVLYKQINIEALAYQEKWQEKVSFIPYVQKKKQKVDFWLYKGDELESCLETPLSIEVNTDLYSRYVIASLPKGNRYTEFYILNTEGKADAYPWQLTSGEPIDLIIGVVNHEYEVANYRVEIKMGAICVKKLNIKTLTHLDKWEERISFTPWMWGKEQKVEFWLYKNDQAEPYYKKPLYFHVDIATPW